MLRTVLVVCTVSVHRRFNHAIDLPPALPTHQAQPRAHLAAPHLDLALSLASPLKARPAQTVSAVNAPLLPEVLVRRGADAQVDLPLASEGVLRYLWESRFGPMLIEVRGGSAFVNGQVVDSADTLKADQ